MESNRYQQGKIYKIISPHTDKIYIGSTCKKYLSQRIKAHKDDYKRWKNEKRNKVSSFDLFELGEVEIILLENYPCSSKDELHSRERYYIEQNIDNIVNKAIPTRTKKEYKQLETYKEQQKEYVKDNIEHIRKYRREYQKSDKMKEYKKKEFICHCGYITTNNNKHYHLKKHSNE
jgi:hypothetical protein